VAARDGFDNRQLEPRIAGISHTIGGIAHIVELTAGD